MSEKKVMRFNWVTEENDDNFWELISNARDDVQFVILDKTTQSVIFQLSIEPTSLVKRNLPGNIHVTDRNEATRRVPMTSRTEGEDSVSVSVCIDSDDERSLFVQQHCSFTPIILKLSTTSYGGGSQPTEIGSVSEHPELISSFVKSNFESHSSSKITPKYVSRCIYESGEFCTFQYYYILVTDHLNLSKLCLLTPGTFHPESQKEGEIFDKLLEGKLFVAIKTQDIADFCRNSGSLLVSTNLLVCLQHILRNS